MAWRSMEMVAQERISSKHHKCGTFTYIHYYMIAILLYTIRIDTHAYGLK